MLLKVKDEVWNVLELCVCREKLIENRDKKNENCKNNMTNSNNKVYICFMIFLIQCCAKCLFIQTKKVENLEIPGVLKAQSP